MGSGMTQAVCPGSNSTCPMRAAVRRAAASSVVVAQADAGDGVAGRTSRPVAVAADALGDEVELVLEVLVRRRPRRDMATTFSEVPAGLGGAVPVGGDPALGALASAGRPRGQLCHEGVDEDVAVDVGEPAVELSVGRPARVGDHAGQQPGVRSCPSPRAAWPARGPCRCAWPAGAGHRTSPRRAAPWHRDAGTSTASARCPWPASAAIASASVIVILGSSMRQRELPIPVQTARRAAATPRQGDDRSAATARDGAAGPYDASMLDPRNRPALIGSLIAGAARLRPAVVVGPLAAPGLDGRLVDPGLRHVRHRQAPGWRRRLARPRGAPPRPGAHRRGRRRLGRPARLPPQDPEAASSSSCSWPPASCGRPSSPGTC